MKSDIIIIGGGLSGLIATWQLNRVGLNATLLEARGRFGGRVLTVERDSGANCDLGPSWIWSGQLVVATLLNRFGIPHYEQYSQGALLFQQPNGAVMRHNAPSPMTGSWRIQGGVSALVDAIAAEIPDTNKRLAHTVTGLSSEGGLIKVDVAHGTEALRIEAKQVAIAMPPRLAAELTYNPALPKDAMHLLRETPTWMAGHAKFFAVYERPFWRDNGLCGTAISQRGPLIEIHDASPDTGELYCLFGFVGIDSAGRKDMGHAELTRRATEQLGLLFGEEATRPRTTHLQDWSAEEFTAGSADQKPQTRHPNYGLSVPAGDVWNGRLDFISSETSYTNGGLIEGALESGLRFAKRVTGQSLPLTAEARQVHKASMDWDWL